MLLLLLLTFLLLPLAPAAYLVSCPSWSCLLGEELSINLVDGGIVLKTVGVMVYGMATTHRHVSHQNGRLHYVTEGAVGSTMGTIEEQEKMRMMTAHLRI